MTGVQTCALPISITIISFVVYAVFAYGGMETVGGVIDSMKHPEKDFPKGLIIG